MHVYLTIADCQFDSMIATAYISVGSNIEPAANITAALAALLKVDGVTVTGSGTFWRTAPIGRPEQPDYRNGIWRVRTFLPPDVLQFEVLRGIEDALGRVRTRDAASMRGEAPATPRQDEDAAARTDRHEQSEDRCSPTRGNDKYAARTIDLDLIFHRRDGEKPSTELSQKERGSLPLPHPDIERPWVAAGILEFEPSLVLPDGRPLASLAPAVPPGEVDRALTDALQEMIDN